VLVCVCVCVCVSVRVCVYVYVCVCVNVFVCSQPSRDQCIHPSRGRSGAVKELERRELVIWGKSEREMGVKRLRGGRRELLSEWLRGGNSQGKVHQLRVIEERGGGAFISRREGSARGDVG